MKLVIQSNIPDTASKEITISFAKLFVNAEYSELRKILSDDVYIIIYNRESKYGVEAVLEYFKDWQSRVGDTFECEVRWSAQFSRPEIYFISDECKQAYILSIDNSKITKILLTPRSFSVVGFSIDEVPYNVGFVKANAPKEIEPLPNHYFCPVCGKDSEHLNWSEGVIFKDGPDWGRKTGFIVNVSICPDCNIVCEAHPNRDFRKCIYMTREQQEKINSRMSDEERSKYVCDSMGNMRPLFKSTLKPRSNELSEFGRKFHKLLKKIVIDNTPELVFSMLDKLSISKNKLRLHVATNQTHDIGDESYFYIGNNENRGFEIYKHLKAEPSIGAAWQIYLLHHARTVMPTFWHGGYIVRDYIFDEASLNDYIPLECYDISGLSRENVLLPEVILSADRRTADVYCTYWNDWKGLMRDHLKITFLRNGRIKLTKIDPLCLFKYKCDILF